MGLQGATLALTRLVFGINLAELKRKQMQRLFKTAEFFAKLKLSGLISRYHQYMQQVVTSELRLIFRTLLVIKTREYVTLCQEIK